LFVSTAATRAYSALSAPAQAEAWPWPGHFTGFGFAQHLKDQSAGDRGRFLELDRNPASEAPPLARPLPHQSVLVIVMHEVLVAEGRDGDKAVGAGVGQPHEEPKPRHSGDAALERRPDAVLKECGD